MAILKTANGKDKYHDENARDIVLHYILNMQKAPRFRGAFHIFTNDPAGEMETVAERFDKASGVKLRHFILAFSNDEHVTPELADKIAKGVCWYLGRKYQTAYAVHEDKEYVHIHIVMNSVSYLDGSRYYGTRAEFHEFKDYIRSVLRRYGLYKLAYVSNIE